MSQYPSSPVITVKITQHPNTVLNNSVKSVKFSADTGIAIEWSLSSVPNGAFKKSKEPGNYGKLPLTGTGSKSFKGGSVSKQPTSSGSGKQSGNIPPSQPMTAANSSVLKNEGLYTDLLSKFHPKTIAHTGPAGQAGVKSLIIKLDNYGQQGKGREVFTGHIKVKMSHSGANVLYYDKAKSGAPLSIFITSAGKTLKPWADKALAQDLAFSVLKKRMVIKSGTLTQATLGQNVIIDGPVKLNNCILDGCAFTQIGLETALLLNCKVNTTWVLDNNKFASGGGYAMWSSLMSTYPTTGEAIQALKAGINLSGAAKDNKYQE
jgi:hypothetical protein